MGSITNSLTVLERLKPSNKIIKKLSFSNDDMIYHHTEDKKEVQGQIKYRVYYSSNTNFEVTIDTIQFNNNFINTYNIENITLNLLSSESESSETSESRVYCKYYKNTLSIDLFTEPNPSETKTVVLDVLHGTGKYINAKKLNYTYYDNSNEANIEIME